MAKYKIIPSSRTIGHSPISIGHKAEKGVEAIEFDLTAWVETYGSGTLTVIMRRWGDAIPYPIALEIDENNKATWTLSDIDTAKAGMAYAQLNYIVGDEVVKKSDIYTFRVMDSLTGEGEPPEAYESWLEHLTHFAAEAMAEVLDIEGIVTDKTLTVDGGIADGKATGDALSALEDAVAEETDKLKADLGDLSDLETESKTDLVSAINEAAQSGLSDAVKDALLACFDNVAFKAGTGRQYYNALQTALYGFPRLRILFNPGTTQLYVNQDVNSLIQFLTVYYQESAETEEILLTSSDYTLKGELNYPVNVVEVEYNECKGQFNVTVDAYHYIKGTNFSWGYGHYDVYEEMPAMFREFKHIRSALTYGEALDGYDINTSGVATRVSYLRSMLVPAGAQQVSAQLSGSNVSLYQVSYVGFAADKVTKVLESNYAAVSTAVSLPNTVRYLFMNIKKSNNADMTQTDLNTTGTITLT